MSPAPTASAAGSFAASAETQGEPEREGGHCRHAHHARDGADEHVGPNQLEVVCDRASLGLRRRRVADSTEAHDGQDPSENTDGCKDPVGRRTIMGASRVILLVISCSQTAAAGLG